MSDLIKRADAIEAIFKVGHEHVEEKVIPLGAVTDYSDAIKALPSSEGQADIVYSAEIVAEAVSDAYDCGFEDAKRAYEVELAMSDEAVQGDCIPIELKKRYPHSRDEDITDAFMRGYQAHAEAAQGWIPFTRRPMTEEEQKDYPNCTFMFDCALPDDGDEILVSNGRFVWMDTFCTDIDGCYLDGGDDIDEDMAWMPLPKPYREDGEV